MNDSDWLAAYQLVQRYANILDAGPPEALGDLFTEDALFESLPRKDRSENFPFPARGRDAIATALGARFAHWGKTFDRIHVMANFMVKEERADGLDTTSWLLVVHTPRDEGAAPQLVLTGRYDDKIVRDNDGQWRFAERLLSRYNEVGKRLAGY